MSRSMPRIFLVLCSLFLTLSFVACDSEAKQIPTNQPPNTSTQTESSTSSAPKMESVPVVSAPQSSTTPETSSGTIPAPNQEPPTVQTPAPVESIPPTTQSPTSNTPETQPREDESVENIQVTIGNKTFTAALAENAAVQAFVEIMKAAPVVINMNDYGGFEKVGSLGENLPTSNNTIRTQSGDIVLYNGNQIVIFYGANTWSYTRLGKIDDLSGLEEALGSGDVTVTFSIEGETVTIPRKE